jgi:hypothetical protein
VRKAATAVADCRPHPFPAFLHRGVGQTNDDNPGLPLPNVDFDLNEDSI